MFDGLLLCVIFFILAIFAVISLFVFLANLIMYRRVFWKPVIVFALCGLVFLSLFIANSNHYNNSDICVWTEQETSRSEIMALKDNVSTQGKFFWGTGTLKGEIVYVFAVKTSNNSFSPKIVSVSDILEIIETNEISPSIISYRWNLNPAHKDWFFFEKDSGSQGYCGEKYRIIVPVGTLDQTFSIDLE